MQDVTLAKVVGKAFIGGVKCDHLLFSRPGVDFQVWVADSGQPLPRKYVVTDTSNPCAAELHTVMSDWNVAPAVADARFTFVPPKGTKAIDFHAAYGPNADTKRRKQMKTILKIAVVATSPCLDAHRRCTASARATGARRACGPRRPAPHCRRGRGRQSTLMDSAQMAQSQQPAAASQQQAAAAQQQTAVAQQQAAAAQQQAAAAKQQAAAAPPAPPPAAAGANRCRWAPSLPPSPGVASPHRSAAWSTTTAAGTSIARCFRGTTWCM